MSDQEKKNLLQISRIRNLHSESKKYANSLLPTMECVYICPRALEQKVQVSRKFQQ